MRTLELLSPCAFSGEEQIEGVLVDGPVRDFNLMVRGGLGTVSVLRGPAIVGGGLVYAHLGACHVNGVEVPTGHCFAAPSELHVSLDGVALFAQKRA